jgi:hypothetical protein
MIRDGSRYDLGMARSEFDRRLEAIEAKVIELFGMVAEDLPRATQALLGRPQRGGAGAG